MSLAMYAAPFENDNKSDVDNNNDSIANKKRQQQSHNKTQKKYPKES